MHPSEAHSAQFWCNISPFRINTCKSVSKQRTLTSFRMNTYEKQAGWGGVLLLTKFPIRKSVLRSPPRRATKDLSCGRYGLLSLHPYFVTSLLPFPSGNSIGSAGGVSAMASSCGYCRRSGSGTFTFGPFRMLMSCSALTTDLPWK